MVDNAAALLIITDEIHRTGPALARAHNDANVGHRQFSAGYLDACIRLGELLGIADPHHLRELATTAASGVH